MGEEEIHQRVVTMAPFRHQVEDIARDAEGWSAQLAAGASEFGSQVLQ
jgi:hypothetical protein